MSEHDQYDYIMINIFCYIC